MRKWLVGSIFKNAIKATNNGNFKSVMNVLFLVLHSVPSATGRRDSSTYISWTSGLAAAIPIPICLKDSTWQLDVFICYFGGRKSASGHGEIIPIGTSGRM